MIFSGASCWAIAVPTATTSLSATSAPPESSSATPVDEPGVRVKIRPLAGDRRILNTSAEVFEG